MECCLWKSAPHCRFYVCVAVQSVCGLPGNGDYLEWREHSTISCFSLMRGSDDGADPLDERPWVMVWVLGSPWWPLGRSVTVGPNQNRGGKLRRLVTGVDICTYASMLFVFASRQTS
eukprot:11670517-Ditylum_brightwellii.AAC.1